MTLNVLLKNRSMIKSPSGPSHDFMDNCHNVSQNVTSKCHCVMCDTQGQLPRTDTRTAIAMVRGLESGDQG